MHRRSYRKDSPLQNPRFLFVVEQLRPSWRDYIGIVQRGSIGCDLVLAVPTSFPGSQKEDPGNEVVAVRGQKKVGGGGERRGRDQVRLGIC